MAASCPYFTSSNSPLPQNYPTPQSQVVLPSMPPAAPRRESNPGNNAAPSSSEPAFFQGTVGSSSHDTVYIHARPPANEEQPVWVTTSWSGLMKELLAQEAVFHNLMDQLRSPTYANRRMQALRILGATVSQASIGGAGLTEGVFGGFPANSSPPAPDFRVDSPLFSSLPEDMSIWSAHRNSIDSSPMSAIPGTPMTSAFNDSDYYSTSPPEQEGALFNGDAPRVLTASQDVIDPVILQERESNEETQEFIWSPLECTLYSMDSMRAQTILKEPEAVRLVFPPQTMMTAKEKDGVLSTPAYTLTHPHSNEWIKAQVCHKHCAYRAGTTSLKRPKTVREHFQKCVWLESTHPLKVLASLQLAVLERESQGLLPRQRRGRVSVPISRLQPYQNTRGSAAAAKSPGAQLQLTNPFVRHTSEVFKEPAHEHHHHSHQQQRPHPLSYNSSPEQQSIKLAPLGMYTGSARILPQSTIHTSPSSSSLSGVSSFEASPRMR